MYRDAYRVHVHMSLHAWSMRFLYFIGPHGSGHHPTLVDCHLVGRKRHLYFR